MDAKVMEKELMVAKSKGEKYAYFLVEPSEYSVWDFEYENETYTLNLQKFGMPIDRALEILNKDSHGYLNGYLTNDWDGLLAHGPYDGDLSKKIFDIVCKSGDIDKLGKLGPVYINIEILLNSQI